MDKNGTVTFGEWNKGQVKHPIYGFGLLQNVEVFENKGIAKIKNALTSTYAASLASLPVAEVYDVYGNTYTLVGDTTFCALYKNGTLLTSLPDQGWDAVIYKDYLFYRHGSKMSAYGPLSAGGATGFADVVTGFNGAYNGKLLVGQDDALYSTNGNYIAKMTVTPAAVGVAPSVSANLIALDLKDGQYATTLEEYGTKIVIGTQGGSNYADRGNHPTASLYSWNRQLGTLGNPGLADLPVIFNENGINAIIQHANKLYVSAGTQGNIYVTDGTNYVKMPSLPYTQTGIDHPCSVYYNAMAISPKGTLLVGLSGSEGATVRTGIYEIEINTAGFPVSFRRTSSFGGLNQLRIGFINSITYNELSVGWNFGLISNVDTSSNILYPEYGAIIETPLVRVGRFNQKKTFQHIEWNLAEPLVDGQGIRISYRRNTKEAYTEINTWTYDTLGGVISFEAKAGIADCEYVQLKIELNQSQTTTVGSNIYLISVAIW